VGPARRSRIHRGLTGERALIGTPYLEDPGLKREYAAEIAPRTGAALAKVLAEVYGSDRRPPRRALDLGAGTDAAGAALRARFGEALDVVSVDRIPGPGIVVADLSRGLPPVEGRFDLIVAAHLLNELFPDLPLAEQVDARARRVLAWSRALLAEDGLLVLVEPALRETSRALLAVRDRLLGWGLHVVAPCFWSGPCPALARERDWCHDTAPGSPGGVSGTRIDFSYLALSPVPARPATPEVFRIVSDALVEKGRLRFYGCGPAGRHPLVRLDRHATPANAAMGTLARGDVATIAGTTPAGDGLRIGPESQVARRPGPPAARSSTDGPAD
jgi:Mitochondrial small ribosomal subunit Rsm22